MAGNALVGNTAAVRGGTEELGGGAHEHVIVQQGEGPESASCDQHILLVQGFLWNFQLACAHHGTVHEGLGRWVHEQRRTMGLESRKSRWNASLRSSCRRCVCGAGDGGGRDGGAGGKQTKQHDLVKRFLDD